MTKASELSRLPTGVPGLDLVLGGGIPEFSFNLLAGGPGTGKTTLAHQIAFANASQSRPTLYFTVLGEPPIKMLRYQKNYTFFDPSRVPDGVRFVHLSGELMQEGPQAVLERIAHEVEATQPSIVVVDSFRSLARTSYRNSQRREFATFVHQLAFFLTSWEATTFLLGEYLHHNNNPMFTIADGVIWLYQSIERNSMVRKVQVLKTRGQAQLPGLHTFRITDAGLQVFPRIGKPEAPLPPVPATLVSSGVAALDDMLHGGIPRGQSVLLAGPSGSGKTVLSLQFIREGVRQREPGVIVVFERPPEDYLRSVRSLLNVDDLIAQGLLQLIYLRPLDLSIDETLFEVAQAVQRSGARRVVIDSLSGFELALAPTFRRDFRDSLYRMVGTLTSLGTTVMMSVELTDTFTELRFSPYGISFLTDIIILQRYVLLEGSLRRLMLVVKHRSSSHQHGVREYEITAEGLQVLGPLAGWQGLLGAAPERSDSRVAGTSERRLLAQDALVVGVLEELGQGDAAAIATHSGLQDAVLEATLQRLATLGAVTLTDGVYRTARILPW